MAPTLSRPPADVAGVRARSERLLGSRDLSRPAVVHVASAWQGPGGRTVTLRIGAAAPRSALDAWVLALTRAESDAILVTGQILREEPRLTYADPDAAPGHGALGAWRREVLGRSTPPWLFVLTRRGDLELGHPALAGWARPVVLAVGEAARGLGPAALSRGIPLEALGEGASVAEVVERVRERFGVGRLSVEAGPTTARALYRPRPLVDELLLSVFEEPELCEAARGPELFAPGELEATLARVGGPSRALEASGRWRFERWALA